MCGRFALRNPSALKDTIESIDIKPRFNIAPNQKIHVITERALKAKWSFTPYWASEPFNLINARSETIWKKKSFKDASKCLVPADGWYEWKKTDSGKIPYFHEHQNELFYFAGIYGGYRGELGVAILTMEASPSLKEIHHRMPVIIDENSKDEWLNSKNFEFSVSRISTLIKAYEVSTYVNNPENDSEICIKQT
tara:strand:+ start:1651 stop:2232 length:582 start_codon:yes stop_codon:yes gene_type:complete